MYYCFLKKRRNKNEDEEMYLRLKQQNEKRIKKKEEEENKNKITTPCMRRYRFNKAAPYLMLIMKIIQINTYTYTSREHGGGVG